MNTEKKYHINPKTGIVSECNAKHKCPFGENAPHFPTVEQAQEYADLKNKEDEIINRIKNSEKVLKAEIMKASDEVKKQAIKKELFLDSLANDTNNEIRLLAKRAIYKDLENKNKKMLSSNTFYEKLFRQRSSDYKIVFTESNMKIFEGKVKGHFVSKNLDFSNDRLVSVCVGNKGTEEVLRSNRHDQIERMIENENFQIEFNNEIQDVCEELNNNYGYNIDYNNENIEDIIKENKEGISIRFAERFDDNEMTERLSTFAQNNIFTAYRTDDNKIIYFYDTEY